MLLPLFEATLPAVTTISTISAAASITTIAVAIVTTIAITSITTSVIATGTGGTLKLKAIATIDGTVFTRDKWYCGGATTGSARCRILLTPCSAPWSTVWLTTATCRAAAWASTGRICETLGCIKLLFTSRKGKIVATVATDKNAIPVALVKHHESIFPFFNYSRSLAQLTMLK
jgi:hypothetical protein